jgi:hypothetical protein
MGLEKSSLARTLAGLAKRIPAKNRPIKLEYSLMILPSLLLRKRRKYSATVVTDFSALSRVENSLLQGFVGKFTTVRFLIQTSLMNARRKLMCVKLIFLLSKTEDFTVLRSEPVYHLSVFLFHVNYLLALRIFISRCARNEG